MLPFAPGVVLGTDHGSKMKAKRKRQPLGILGTARGRVIALIRDKKMKSQMPFPVE